MVAHAPASQIHRSFSLWIGIALLLGLVANLIAIVQFRRVAKGFSAEEIPAGYWTDADMWMSAALIGIALTLIIYIVQSA